MGASITKATSKKTGIAIIKPVITMAAGAFLTPNFLTKKLANDSSPPELSRIAPNKAPNHTTVATKPNVLPMPV